MDVLFVSNIVLEILIAILSIIGNGVVLAALYKDRSLQTVTNYLIASLATADLFTGIGIPFLILPLYGLPNEFYSCLFVNCIIVICTGISNLHLLAIAAERFIAIRFPFWYHANFKVRHAVAIATFAWVTGTILGLVPMMGWNNGWNDDNICGFVEVMSLEQHVYFHFYGVILTPMFFTILIYIFIFVEVKRAARQIEDLKVNHEGAGTGQGKVKSEVKAEIRAAKRFALVIGIFGLSWFPLEIMNCVTIYYNLVCIECVIVAVLFSHLNSVINPFLYAYGNSNLRRTMVNVLRCRNVVEPMRENSSTMSSSD